jgi:hypothetical protein
MQTGDGTLLGLTLNNMKINKYRPFAFIYFFLNSVGLPTGLLYTTILSPLFYAWLAQQNKGSFIKWFFLLLSPFVLVHFFYGVDTYTYLKSTALLLSVYIFGYAAYYFVNTYEGMEGILKKLLVTNFTLTLVAIIAYFTPLKTTFWTISDISTGMTNFSRLSLFTYEPSYYSTLLIPLFVFFFLEFLKETKLSNFYKLMMIVLPLALSFSLGVLASLAMAMIVFFLFNMLRINPKKKIIWFTTILLLTGSISIIILLILYPQNPLFERIYNVFEGTDTSGRGRTTEAFLLAYQIAELKSVWWGVGLGQIKIVGNNIIRTFYNLPLNDYSFSVRIPCAFAETLAVFGIIGSFVRIFTQIYCFFKEKVIYNYYQTILFLFIFVYQFTGSYFTNVAELIIWILCFSNIFKKFDSTNHSELNTKAIAHFS